MKTSTKIFIGAACAVVVCCVVNLLTAQTQSKKYNPVALALARQLGATQIRVVDVTVGQDNNTWAPLNREAYRRSDSSDSRLKVQIQEMELARVAGDTLYLEFPQYHTSVVWPIFMSPALETVVVHQAGKDDKAFEY